MLVLASMLQSLLAIVPLDTVEKSSKTTGLGKQGAAKSMIAIGVGFIKTALLPKCFELCVRAWVRLFLCVCACRLNY